MPLAFTLAVEDITVRWRARTAPPRPTRACRIHNQEVARVAAGYTPESRGRIPGAPI